MNPIFFGPHACPSGPWRVLLVALWSVLLAGRAEMAGADPKPPVPCLFNAPTLVPRLALGVRRVDGDEIDSLALRDRPEAAAPVVREAPLFRPLFVAASRVDPAGGEWYLLQDGYAAVTSLGWARGRHLHLTESRYAYTFATRERESLADLHDVSQEAYRRLLAQLAGDSAGAAETVVVRERPEAHRWRPVAIDDLVPFVELRIPEDQRDREHPDTTPTFRFGIPVENRLVHLGAVCGGPIDLERLRSLKADAVGQHGLEMLFVVDDTTSMNPFNRVVAKFISSAGRLALNRPVPVRMAVCSYSDGPVGQRVRLGRFTTVTGPEDVRDLSAMVELLGDKLPPGAYANPPERLLEGLRDALAKVQFTRGSIPFVAVVGDTGHEPADAAKGGLIEEVARLLAKSGARVYFMHVGQRMRPDEKLFQADFLALREAAAAVGVPEDRLTYQPAEENTLLVSLEQARDAVEEERLRLERQIRRMESRSPHTEPGPKLLAALEKRGIPRGSLDERHLQYFVPSRGWLFHPANGETGGAQPQLRELFFLAPPEREAVNRFFAELRNTLSRGDPLDGDTLIGGFARDLAGAAGSPGLEATVLAAWRSLPARQRSVGVFMEDIFGLRLKAALPFPPNAYSRESPATAQEIERLMERIGRLAEACKSGGDAAFWFEATSLVP